MRLPLPLLPIIPHRRVATAALALAISLAAVAWHALVERQFIGLNEAVVHTRQQLSQAPASPSVETPRVDFVEGLPINPSIDPVVREFQRASSELGVVFVAVTSTPRAATVQTLGRTELTITLRGPYPKLKNVLAVTLDRFPALLAQRLSLRRMATPLDLEAHLDFVLLSRPLSASGVGS